MITKIKLRNGEEFDTKHVHRRDIDNIVTKIKYVSGICKDFYQVSFRDETFANIQLSDVLYVRQTK